MEQTNGQKDFKTIAKDNNIIYVLNNVTYFGKVIQTFRKNMKVNYVKIDHKVNDVYVCEIKQYITEFRDITDFKIISEMEYLKKFSDNIKEFETKHNCNVIMEYEFEKIRYTLDYNLKNMKCLGKFNEGDKKIYHIIYWSGGGEIQQFSKCNRLHFKDKDEVEKEYRKLYGLLQDKLINNLEISYMSFESYKNWMIRTFETYTYEDTFEVKTLLEY